MAKILLVDDDVNLADSIEETLSAQGFIVDMASSVKEAESLLSVSQYDLIVVDWMMPEKTGIEFIGELRGRGWHSPILMLTGRAAIDDKATGLDQGADDCLVKPFNSKELVARVRALMRRPARYDEPQIQINEFVLDTGSRTLYRSGQQIALTKQEYALLEFLMRNKDQVFSSEALVERAWSSFSEASPDTVRVHITRLRKKLETGSEDSPIKTLHRQGYGFMSRTEQQ
jgi:two-component system, OmpR family, manganese sensing response regulator